VLLLPDRSRYIYLEKSKGGQGGRSVREERMVLRSDEEPPASLKKKATLLWYFEGYLKGANFRVRSNKHPGRVSGECVGPGPVDESGADEVGVAEDSTYVKKWLKTRHAIIFRLSNKVIQVRGGNIIHNLTTLRTLSLEHFQLYDVCGGKTEWCVCVTCFGSVGLQVDFNDETEIVLSSEMQSVTYVNKSRESTTHWLSQLPQDVELLKRLKYTKDILLQLIGGSGSGNSSGSSASAAVPPTTMAPPSGVTLHN
jgi:polo-like kinase 1